MTSKEMPEENTIEELTQIEQRLAKAWVKSDRDTILSILASDWTVIDITGRICERYVNSSAAVAHLKAFGTMYGERFASVVDRKRFTVFGTPSHELRQMLDRFGEVYCPRLAGFSRI